MKKDEPVLQEPPQELVSQQQDDEQEENLPVKQKVLAKEILIKIQKDTQLQEEERVKKLIASKAQKRAKELLKLQQDAQLQQEEQIKKIAKQQEPVDIILPIGSVPETIFEQPTGQSRPKKNIVFDTPQPPSGIPRERVHYLIPQAEEQIRTPSTIRQPKPKSSPTEPITKIPKESVVGMSPDELQVAKEVKLLFDEIQRQPQPALEQPKGKYRPKRSEVPDTIPPPPSGSPRKRPPPSSGPPRKRVVHYLIPQAEEQTRPLSTIPQPKPKASPIETITNIPKKSVVGMSPDEILVATKEFNLVFDEIQRQPQPALEQPKGKYRPKRRVVPDTDPTVKTIGLQRDIDTTQSDVEKVLSQQRVVEQEKLKKSQQLLLAQQEARLLAQQEAERLLLEQQEAQLLAQQEEARLLAEQEARLLAQKEAENKSEKEARRLKALQKVEEVRQAARNKKEKENLQKEIDDQRTQLLARQEEERQEAARKKQKDLDDQLARQEAARQEEEQILQRYYKQKEETGIDKILPIFWKTTDAERQEIEWQEAQRQEAERQRQIIFKKKKNIVVNPPLPMTHNLSTPPPKSTPDPIFITPPPSQEEVITPTSSQDNPLTPTEKKTRKPNRSKEEIAQEKADIEKRRIERVEKKEKEEKEKAEKEKEKAEKAKAKEEKAKAKPKPPSQGTGLLNHREQTTHRFKVLKGELLAGNTSKLVVNEMKSLVKQLVQMRELTNDQCQLILKELKTL